MRRETGKSVQVRRDDGVAIHISPKPCVAIGEDGREASVGEHIGQPSSPVKIHIPGADAVAKVEGNPDGRVSASAWTARRGRRNWHVWKLAREPGDPTSVAARRNGPRFASTSPDRLISVEIHAPGFDDACFITTRHRRVCFRSSPGKHTCSGSCPKRGIFLRGTAGDQCALMARRSVA